MQSINELKHSLITPHAPTQSWSEQQCGLINISIDQQGQWFHDGKIIHRKSLIRLFSSVLSYEKGVYFLTTPAERCEISVADVPFLIVSWQQVITKEGAVIVCEDNIGRHWPICEDYPLISKDFKQQKIPYLCLNYGLQGRIARNVYYQWAEIAHEHNNTLAIYSANRHHTISSIT